MNKLEAEKIVLSYGAQIPAIVRGISLALSPGEFTGVVGPNGSGKSTVLRALSRVLAPQHGAVLLDGRNLYSMSARESAQSIATVPQSTTIAFEFTVREIVEMGRSPHRSRSPFAGADTKDAEIVDEAMAQADVTALADRVASTLSGGEQQRVLLARALAQQPAVLLLDEPTSHLDLHHQTQVLRLVRELTRTRHIATMAVLHDLNLAATYADKIVLMAAGQTIAQGPPREVLTESNVHQAYGARVWVRCHPVSGRPFVVTLPDNPFETVAAEDAPNVTVHVVCGGGTGVGLLLRLRQLGYNVSAGALNSGDTDQEAAEMLGVPYAKESPFTPFSEPVIARANELQQLADVVVVTDVPFGFGNLSNLKSALDARRAGKIVLALDSPAQDSRAGTPAPHLEVEESSQAGTPTSHLETPTKQFADRDFTDGVASGLWIELMALGMMTAGETEALIDLISSSLSTDNTKR